jgi:hypothetical protein
VAPCLVLVDVEAAQLLELVRRRVRQGPCAGRPQGGAQATKHLHKRNWGCLLLIHELDGAGCSAAERLWCEEAESGRRLPTTMLSRSALCPNGGPPG